LIPDAPLRTEQDVAAPSPLLQGALIGGLVGGLGGGLLVITAIGGYIIYKRRRAGAGAP
jgi:hypothetical protein